jgi:DNA-binding XRE family transcriptional regulator
MPKPDWYRDPVGWSRGAQLLEAWRGKRAQAEAARLLELDKTAYNRFARGIRRPSTKLALQIERLTDGRVTVASWFKPALGIKRAKAA